MIKLYCAHGINQPRSFKFQENKEMRTFNNYNLKKFNEIRKTPSVNNYYLVNICQNKNKEKPHIQNRKNKLAIDTDIINNNIPFQDKYYSRVESKSNVVPKELILNIKSSNKKLLKCLGCDYSNQSSNILTEPKCEYLKNKTKQKKVINFNYEPINSCSTRNSQRK